MLFSRTFAPFVVGVLMVCANRACAFETAEDQKNQYTVRSKDTNSSSSDDSNYTNPLDRKYAEEPVKVPLRHHRKNTINPKSLKKAYNRNYVSPSDSLPPAYFYTSWTPATYTISRPYYIPAWGPVGGVPIFFPPQPLLVNPGYPPRNPPPNREYLPPYENPPPVTAPVPPIESPNISNKFGDDGDDAPVWDLDDSSVSFGRPSGGKNNKAPTRRPRPPQQQQQQQTSTFPPVVHRPTPSEESNSINSLSSGNNRIPPPPPPVAAATVATPGRCVWAIISCCSDASQDLRNVCFDQLGCSGPFWDKSPCDSEFGRAALNAALDFYKGG